MRVSPGRGLRASAAGCHTPPRLGLQTGHNTHFRDITRRNDEVPAVMPETSGERQELATSWGFVLFQPLLWLIKRRGTVGTV